MKPVDTTDKKKPVEISKAWHNTIEKSQKQTKYHKGFNRLASS